MKTLNKLKVAVAAATLMSGSAFSAIITDWTYVNELGFESWVSTAGGTTGITATGVGDNSLVLGATDMSTTATGLSWGVPTYEGGVTNGQSSLSIDTPVVGSIETDNGFMPGTDITHNNWIVGTGSGQLESAVMLDALSLTATEIDGAPMPPLTPFAIPAPVLTFNVEFFETPNMVDYDFAPYPHINSKDIIAGTCKDGTANGVGVNVNGCADIFVISSDTPNLNISYDGSDLVLTTSFNFNGTELDELLGGVDYILETRLGGVNPLTDEACLAVGEAAGCFGWLSPEEGSNLLEASYKITAHIPEPGTLAAFGLGLLGLAGAVRRRKA